MIICYLYVINRLTNPEKINGDIIISTIQKLFAVLTGRKDDEINEDSRDQLKLDFKWIVSEEDDDRTLAEMISQIKEESANIAKAVAELEKLIGEVDE